MHRIHASLPSLAALLAVAILVPAALAEPWEILPADGSYGAGRSNQIALDADGLPHVAYWHVLTGVRHAWFDGTGWQNELVEVPIGGVAEAGARPSDPASPQLLISVAVSAAVFGDTPMLAYAKSNYLGHTPVHGPIRFGVREAGGWVVETVGTLLGQTPELAVGPGGEVHLVFLSGDRLVHAERAGSIWALDTAAAGIGSVLSLRVDAGGVPHLAYASGSTLLYAVRTPQGWVSEPVASPGGGPSLILDAQGRPRIAYLAGASPPFTLTYAERTAEGWSGEPVAPIGTQYVRPWLALDPGGRPRITYATGPEVGLDLRFAWRNGGPWATEAVDTAGTVGQSPSLAIDAGGRPWISYNRPAGDVLLAATELSPIGVEPAAGPSRLAVGVSGANPGRAGERLALFVDSPIEQDIALDLFDTAGRRIAALRLPRLAAGRRALAWSVGTRAPGLYLIRARGASGAQVVSRVVLLD